MLDASGLNFDRARAFTFALAFFIGAASAQSIYAATYTG